jgi:hypothetical protein
MLVYLMIGTSLPPPQVRVTPAVNPLLDVSQNHWPVDGRYTVMSARPSPSKSASNGKSLPPPHVSVKPAV